MNVDLEESIRKGKEHIQKGQALGKDTKPLEEKVIALEERFSKHILQLRLSELSRRNIALKIYSEILGCEVWLCGTEEMAAQLRQDAPEVTVYTADEMGRLMSLNPDPQGLRNVHIAKAIFPGSKVIDSRLKEDGIE